MNPIIFTFTNAIDMDKVKAFFKKLQFWKKGEGKAQVKDNPKKKEKDATAKPKLRKRTRRVFVVLIWIGALAPWLIFWLWLRSAGSEGMPSTKELENPKSHEASEIYSSNSELMGKYYAENRTPVTFAELSPYLVDALISTEDERYYEHSGVDVKALPRVAKGMISGDQSSGGGSTISQQLAKMLFSKRDFSDLGKWGKMKALIDVKLKEWILATELEKKFTKNEIITMYFNKFDFLYNAVGIHSAARVYFNTTPDSLNMQQCAMLVGMAKNPAYFNPRRFPERTLGRRNQVLKQWLKNSDQGNEALKHKISKSQCDSLMATDIILDYQEVDHQSGIAPYFREILRESLVDTLANMYMKDFKLMKKVLSPTEYSEFLDSLNRFPSGLKEVDFGSVSKRFLGYVSLMKRDFVDEERETEQLDPIKTLVYNITYHAERGNYYDAFLFMEDLEKEAKRSKLIPKKHRYGFNTEIALFRSQMESKRMYSRKKMYFQNWAKFMIYNKGLRIYTTIDSRMQRHAEWAVKEWLGTTLQAEFEKKQKKRLKDEYPFDLKKNFYKKEDRDSVILNLIDQGIRRSDRWKSMRKAGISEAERYKSFDTPVEMTVFKWGGDTTMTMSPRDSVRYYKQFFQAGMMAMDPKSGFVKAWVGGTDFYHFKYDHVIKSRRQVGSTFKPFVYASALDMGKITPCTEVPNVQYCVDIPYNKYRSKQWCPKGSQYDDVLTSMKFGLAGSMNNITAYVMNEVKPINVVKRAIDMGIDPNYLDTVPALALGIADLTVYEMTGAQSTFVNKGLFTRPIIISRIEDKLGNVIYDADPQMREVFKEETAYLTLQLMKGVMSGATRRDGKSAGTAAGIRGSYHKWGGIRQPMAGKTGTTQNGSDGWFIGLTPDLVTGVWVGAEDRAVHFPTLTWGQGGRMALPIYGFFMQKVYADKGLKISEKDFEKPSQPIPADMWDCNFKDSPDDNPNYGDGEGDMEFEKKDGDEKEEFDFFGAG